jgi:ATP synthase protein I
MQVNDARILRGAAIPTTAVGVLVTVLLAVLAGPKGLLGAVLGLAVVVAFFTAGLLVITWAARTLPHALMNIALLSYLVKVGLLGVLLMIVRGTTLFDTRAFGWAALVSTLVWVAAEVRVFVRMKIFYTEPAATPGARVAAAPVESANGGSAGGQAAAGGGAGT